MLGVGVLGLGVTTRKTISLAVEIGLGRGHSVWGQTYLLTQSILQEWYLILLFAFYC